MQSKCRPGGGGGACRLRGTSLELTPQAAPVRPSDHRGHGTHGICARRGAVCETAPAQREQHVDAQTLPRDQGRQDAGAYSSAPALSAGDTHVQGSGRLTICALFFTSSPRSQGFEDKGKGGSVPNASGPRRKPRRHKRTERLERVTRDSRPQEEIAL